MEDIKKLVDTFEDSFKKVESYNNLCRQIISDNDLDSFLQSVTDFSKDFKDEIFVHYVRLGCYQAVASSVRQRAKDLLGSES